MSVEELGVGPLHMECRPSSTSCRSFSCIELVLTGIVVLEFLLNEIVEIGENG